MLIYGLKDFLFFIC